MDLREVGDDYLVEEVFIVFFFIYIVDTNNAFFFFSSLKMIVQSMFFFYILQVKSLKKLNHPNVVKLKEVIRFVSFCLIENVNVDLNLTQIALQMKIK